MIRETIRIKNTFNLPKFIAELTRALESIPEASRAKANYDADDEEVSYYREETNSDREKKADAARKLIANLDKQKADAEDMLKRLTKTKP